MICKCGHEKAWHFPMNNLKKRWCKHRGERFEAYDCICKKFEAENHSPVKFQTSDTPEDTQLGSLTPSSGFNLSDIKEIVGIPIDEVIEVLENYKRENKLAGDKLK